MTNIRATKTVILAIVTILLCTCSLVGEDTSEEFRILLPGKFHRSDITFAVGGSWYGLFKTDSGHVLQSVKVTTKPCYDPMVDRAGETTGVSIQIDSPLLTPIILIQSPQDLATGLVPTTFSGYEPIEPGGLINLGKNTLTAYGKTTDEGFRHPGDLLILDYQVILFLHPYAEEERQIIVEYEKSVYASLPALLWAGDLDGDEKLDLLLDIRNHYNVTQPALFLSSEANTDDMVKLVADLRMLGC